VNDVMLTQFIKDLPDGWPIRKLNDLLTEPVRNGVYKAVSKLIDDIVPRRHSRVL
jgi:hypothetical protein